VLDDMDFWLFAAFQREWSLRPPAHWQLAKLTGARGKATSPSAGGGNGDEPVQSLSASFPDGIIR
jgi:hypothetical protein